VGRKWYYLMASDLVLEGLDINFLKETPSGILQKMY
jgi:hypothetical protein